MGWTFSEEEWNEIIMMFERSKIPDHTEGLLKLVKMLKREVEHAHERFEDYKPHDE